MHHEYRRYGTIVLVLQYVDGNFSAVVSTYVNIVKLYTRSLYCVAINASRSS